jgi:hypothetical protein
LLFALIHCGPILPELVEGDNRQVLPVFWRFCPIAKTVGGRQRPGKCRFSLLTFYPRSLNQGAACQKANSVSNLRITAMLPIKPPHFFKHFPDFGCGGPA